MNAHPFESLGGRLARLIYEDLTRRFKSSTRIGQIREEDLLTTAELVRKHLKENEL